MEVNITPYQKPLRRVMKEAEIKRAIEDYLTLLSNQGKLWWTRLQSGVIFKDGYAIKTSEKGTADILVLDPAWGDAYPVFLEVKAPKGKQSEAQKEFQEKVEAIGAEYHIVRHVDEVIDILGGR